MILPSPGAHPHSRGENRISNDSGSVRAGSSPLTRGKPALRGLRPASVGLIPTHAGKTFSGTLKLHCDRAHPHSRGENSDWDTMDGRAGGSSPLTRGKRRAPGNAPQRHRLIPTHAGKTGLAPARERGRTAHPHSRGENGSQPFNIMPPYGSSPLTRGKRERTSCAPTPTGLIPTHAGKTAHPWPGPQGPGAHPHSRGENPALAGTGLALGGSSPLTRGKRAGLGRVSDTHGLIPTHAGKTATT